MTAPVLADHPSRSPQPRIDTPIGLADAARRFGAWMRLDALPLWSDAGFCEADGGFYESLDRYGEPLVQADRRVRVQFRQIYVYARAHQMGWSESGLDHAASAFEYVVQHAWRADGEPGWIGLLGADGSPRSLERDAYDHAFALFALAWYYRASGDPRALTMIKLTQAFIDKHIATPSGGWAETARGGERIRRQNPHMHAFEAYLALYEALDDPIWLRRAERMLTLFHSRFYERGVGRVREYFTPALRPAGAVDQREEPGHGAEWAWLLSEHRRLTGLGDTDVSEALLWRARNAGSSLEEPFLVDELNGTGAVSKASRRLWPQTELLRACVAAVRDTGDRRAAFCARAVTAKMLSRYLAASQPGSWIDAFDGQGRPVDAPAPASTLYHLFGAAAALAEIADSDSIAPDARVEHAAA